MNQNTQIAVSGNKGSSIVLECCNIIFGLIFLLELGTVIGLVSPTAVSVAMIIGSVMCVLLMYYFVADTLVRFYSAKGMTVFWTVLTIISVICSPLSIAGIFIKEMELLSQWVNAFVTLLYFLAILHLSLHERGICTCRFITDDSDKDEIV